MVAEPVSPLRAFARICFRAGRRFTTAIATLLKNALRRNTDGAQRSAALLLFASLALLGTGVCFGAQLSTTSALVVCLIGAVGLLVSGLTGSQLDATGQAARPSAGDYPRLHR